MPDLYFANMIGSVKKFLHELQFFREGERDGQLNWAIPEKKQPGEVVWDFSGQAY